MNTSIFQQIRSLTTCIIRQFEIQQEIFRLLNSYAKGEHMAQWSRVDPQAVLAEVYQRLASGYGELEQAHKICVENEKENNQNASV